MSSQAEERFVRQLRELGVYEEIKAICLKNGFTSVASLYGKERYRHVASARHEAMYLLRERFNLSYPVIGSYFNKDHTTVMAAIHKVASARRDADEKG